MLLNLKSKGRSMTDGHAESEKYIKGKRGLYLHKKPFFNKRELNNYYYYSTFIMNSRF